jgi:non-homologous end joining protein Ku
MAKIKAHVTSFVIRYGAAATTGRLLYLKRPSSEPKFKYCTPSGGAVKQQYVDEAGTAWAIPELHRAIETDDGLKYIGKEVVSETKKSSLPLNVLNLTVHRKEDIDRLPSDGSPYIFVPDDKDPINVQWHDFIAVAVRESGAAFVGMCNLRNSEGLIRLTMNQGHLTVQKILYPDELNEFEEIHPELDGPTRAKALAIIAKNVEDFDPSMYRNQTAERLAALAESEFEPGQVQDKPAPVTIDLLAALDDFEL